MSHENRAPSWRERHALTGDTSQLMIIIMGYWIRVCYHGNWELGIRSDQLDPRTRDD